MDLTQLDADMGAIMADWPDTLTYDANQSPLACVLEDQGAGKTQDVDGYDTLADCVAHLRVSTLSAANLIGPNGLPTIVSKKHVYIISRAGKDYRIERTAFTADRVELVLYLVDPTK
jgi:hypothetical protein